MFARKPKRNYRAGALASVILCLCILIAVLAWPESPVEEDTGYDDRGDSYIQSDDSVSQGDRYGEENEIESNEDEDFLPGMANGSLSSLPEENLSENEENSMIHSETSYYLVKKAGDVIVVFFCDASGNMVQLETTGILYGMLGPEDQKLFDVGIRIESQEELGILLQDFEG